MSEPAGLDLDRLVSWAGSSDLALTPPLVATPLGGGRSNLTYALRDATGFAFVLRRPPHGQLLATAHDVTREAHVIAGVGRIGVPVPELLATCPDPTVLGAPFAVFTLVDGIVLADGPAAAAAPAGLRAACGPALIDALSRLHRADLDEMGLDDLRRPGGYVERQLRRWRRQWEASSTSVAPAIEAAYGELCRSVPPEQASALVHGDPKLDNCIFSPSGELRALVDWELAAVGDPLADLGMLLAYWSEPDDAIVALQNPPTSLAGFARRDDLVQRYAETSGLDLSRLSYYVGFACWKLACIVQGVYRRLIDGASESDLDPEPFAAQVLRLGDLALEALSAD